MPLRDMLEHADRFVLAVGGYRSPPPRRRATGGRSGIVRRAVRQSSREPMPASNGVSNGESTRPEAGTPTEKAAAARGLGEAPVLEPMPALPPRPAAVEAVATDDAQPDGMGTSSDQDVDQGSDGDELVDDVAPKHFLAVMRHSSRLDEALEKEEDNVMDVDHARTEDGAPLEDAPGSKPSNRRDAEVSGRQVLSTPWPDQQSRPYDTPIVDEALPAEQAKALMQHGFGQSQVVCSPFRRCLQTAGVVARQLGVSQVTVHLGLGERMDKVRKEITEAQQVPSLDDTSQVSEAASGGGVAASGKGLAAEFTYLEQEAMSQALGTGVEVDGVVGQPPPMEESGVEAKERFISVLADVCQSDLRRGPVIVVAHGDTLDAAGESLAKHIVYEASYCAWAVFDLRDGGRLVDSYGIQTIALG